MPASDPDSRLPIAIVGLNFGRHIVEELRSGEASRWFRLAVVCDRDRGLADAQAAASGARACYDLDELLADPGIPVVGLFTGPAGRAGLLRRIIRAGKHCMTTKPLEEDVPAAMAVLREARALGRAIHLNSPAPVPAPDLQRIAAWRGEFALGRPVSAYAETYVSYRERADGTWYDDPRLCPAAPIYRLGIYLINDLIALFGAPARVQVQTSRLFTGRPTADNAQVGIAFADGALATVSASFAIADGDHYRNSLILHFENGTITRDIGPARGGAAAQLALVTRGPDGTRRIAAECAVESRSGAYRWDLLHRVALGGSIEGELPVETAIAGLQVIDAVRRAEAGDGVAEIRSGAAS
jgi:predicted dehydrogenase